VTALLITGRTGCSIASDHVHDEADLWTGRLTSGPEKQRGIPSPVLATSRRESGSIHNPQRFVVLVVFCWDYGSADFNGLRLDNDFT